MLVTVVRGEAVKAVATEGRAEAEVLAHKLETETSSTAAVGSGMPVGLPAGASGTVFGLVDESGTVVAATGPGLRVPAQAPAGTAQVVGPGEVSVTIAGRTYQLRAESQLAPVQAAVDALVRTLLMAGPLLVLGVALSAWIIIGRALAPVDVIISRANAIDGGCLEERIPVPSSGDEITNLARTVNAMLARIQEYAERQRRFVSDASHELRSPIAASRAQLEAGLVAGDATDWHRVGRTVLGEQVRLGTLVDDLLMLARLDEGGVRSAREIDLDEVVMQAASSASGMAIDVSRVSPTRLHGDLRAIESLARNLMDNAQRYAASMVRVSLQETDGFARLIVEDDGPGVPEALRRRIFERFSREEDSRTRDSGGAGLGLALVRAVARSHGGDVSVADSTLGGALFDVRLPLTRAS
jgi:signal transduction histidine kinase